jgi:hypothetical protein
MVRRAAVYQGAIYGAYADDASDASWNQCQYASGAVGAAGLEWGTDTPTSPPGSGKGREEMQLIWWYSAVPVRAQRDITTLLRRQLTASQYRYEITTDSLSAEAIGLPTIA